MKSIDKGITQVLNAMKLNHG